MGSVWCEQLQQAVVIAQEASTESSKASWETNYFDTHLIQTNIFKHLLLPWLFTCQYAHGSCLQFLLTSMRKFLIPISIAQ